METLRAVGFWFGMFLVGTAVAYFFWREKVVSAEAAGAIWAAYVIALIQRLVRAQGRKNRPRHVTRIVLAAIVCFLVAVLVVFAISHELI